MLARSKLALLHVAKARVGMTDDDYHAMLQRIAGVSSSTKLDDWGFDSVMAEFERLGFVSTARRKVFGGKRAGMASPAQITKIRTLWASYTSGQGTDASLGKWLDGHFKVSALRFVAAELAPKVIGALSNMNQRRRIEPDKK